MTSPFSKEKIGKHKSPFSAIARKELRQFWPVAALALLTVCGFVVGILDLVSYYRREDYGFAPFPFSGNYAVILTTAIFPLIAAALGFSQFFFETKPDLWAFLVHRPVHRSVIFRGKIAAGLLMYFVVTLIPFTFGLLWQSDPKHIPAPFDWSLAIPGYVDALNGVSYYFAAIVIARRQARWLGSRIFPIGLPIMSSLVMVGTGSLLIAAGFATLLIVVTFVAARSVFVSGGFYSTQPAGARFSLGMMVVCGALFVGGIVMLIGSVLFDNGVRDSEYYAYVIVHDGIIARKHQVTFNGRLTTDTTDLEGRRIPQPANWQEAQGTWSSLPDRSWPSFYLKRYRNADRSYVSLGRRDGQDFYYDGRRGSILVYNASPRRFLGSIGPGGFVPGKYEPGGSFGEIVFPYYYDMSPLDAFVAGSSVYRVRNYGEPRVEKIYTAPAGERALGTFVLSVKEKNVVDLIAVATSARVVVLRKDGSIVAEIPIAEIPRGTLYVWRSAASDRFIAWYDQSYMASGRPYEFVAVDARSKQVTQTTLPALGGYVMRGDSAAEYAPAVAVPPVLFAVAIVGEMLDAKCAGRPWDLPFEHMGDGGWWALGFGSLGVVFGLVGVMWLSRRYAFSRSQTIVWCVLAIALGVASFVLMLLLLDLPARVACASCKKRRVINRDRCEHCNAAFAAPLANGTEIFESHRENVEAIPA